MTTDERAATAPLDEFIAAYESDDNEWWRIGCGHHQNLFDAAVDARDEAVAERDAALAERDELREQLGPCHCDGNPETTQGPGEDCPQHGRPYSYWAEGCQVIADDRAAIGTERDALHRQLAEARQWITNCVDPLAVGAEVKQSMLDKIDAALAASVSPQPETCEHGRTEAHSIYDFDMTRECSGPGPVTATPDGIEAAKETMPGWFIDDDANGIPTLWAPHSERPRPIIDKRTSGDSLWRLIDAVFSA